MEQSIQIKQWMKVAMGVVRCDALDADHPMHPYNQALAQGVVPEEYGIENPLAIEFADYNRADLINEILQLRRML
jgi:hypothetical protein